MWMTGTSILLAAVIFVKPAFTQELFLFSNGKCLNKDKKEMGRHEGLSDCGKRELGYVEGNRWNNKSMRGISFRGSRIFNTRIDVVFMEYALLKESVWDTIKAHRLEWMNSDLRGVFLKNFYCSQCHLQGGDLRAVRFVDVKFFNSDFRHTKIGQSYFLRAYFENVDFRDADLTAVETFSTRFVNCLVDNSTKLPWPRAVAEKMGFVYQ